MIFIHLPLHMHQGLLPSPQLLNKVDNQFPLHLHQKVDNHLPLHMHQGILPLCICSTRWPLPAKWCGLWVFCQRWAPSREAHLLRFAKGARLETDRVGLVQLVSEVLLKIRRKKYCSFSRPSGKVFYSPTSAIYLMYQYSNVKGHNVSCFSNK